MSKWGPAREAPEQGSKWWVPQLRGEQLLGKLDRIDENSNGEFAVFDALLVDRDEGAIRTGEVYTGATAIMGVIGTADVGRHFSIMYAGMHGKARIFDVVPVDVDKVEAFRSHIRGLKNRSAGDPF